MRRQRRYVRIVLLYGTLLSSIVLNCVPATVLGQEDKPITKESLVRSLRAGKLAKKRRLSAERYVELIKRQGVNFRMAVVDEQEIRQAGAYLGSEGLAILISAVRANFHTAKATPPNIPSNIEPVPAQEDPINIGLTCSGAPIRSGRVPFLISILKENNTNNSEKASLVYLRFYYLKKTGPSFNQDSEYLDKLANVLPGCPSRNVKLLGQDPILDKDLDALNFKDNVNYVDYPFPIVDTVPARAVNAGPHISLRVAIFDPIYSASGEVEAITVRVQVFP
jgi:hypothetical protein